MRINENGFIKILREMDKSSLNNKKGERIKSIEKLSKFDKMFIEIYLRAKEEYSSRLFNNFPDVVNNIISYSKSKKNDV